MAVALAGFLTPLERLEDDTPKAESTQDGPYDRTTNQPAVNARNHGFGIGLDAALQHAQMNTKAIAAMIPRIISAFIQHLLPSQ